MSSITAGRKQAGGVWTNGTFEIEWQTDDIVKVTKNQSGFKSVALVDGGDFETILETLFVKRLVRSKPLE